MLETNRKKVFISYSHKDGKWLERLRVHIKDLERRGLVEVWDDTKIQPGAEWRQEIDNALASASVAVLLVSADFIASNFIAENELPPLLAAAEKKGVVILPLIIGPSLFETIESLARFQSINSPSKPLIGLSKAKQEACLVKLSRTILGLVDEPAKNPSWSQVADDAIPRVTALAVNKRVVAVIVLTAIVLLIVIASLFWWKLSDRSLPSTDVIAARLGSQPGSGATATPANTRRYDVEAGFPTGSPPGTVYATIGFTVWRTRPTTARDGEDAARETIDSQEMVAERIADTIADGDRLYLAIESLTGEFLPDKGGFCT